MPRGVVITWSTETKHSVPVLPVFMRHVRDARGARHGVADAQRLDRSSIRRRPTSGAAAAPAAGSRREWDGRRGRASDIGTTGSARHQCAVNGAASPVFRLADLEEQRRAQSRHQLRGDDVGGFLGAADPLPQDDRWSGYGFCHDCSLALWSCAGLGERLAVSEALADRRARRHSGAARRRRSPPAPHRSPDRRASSTSMRRRCGCTARSAMVLTSANAMSASARRFSSSSRVIVAKLSPTVWSVSCAVADALDHVGKSRIVGQRGLAQHVGAEFLPFALALDRDQDVLAVLRAKHAIGRDRGMREAHPLAADCRLPH